MTYEETTVQSFPTLSFDSIMSSSTFSCICSSTWFTSHWSRGGKGGGGAGGWSWCRLILSIVVGSVSVVVVGGIAQCWGLNIRDGRKWG